MTHAVAPGVAWEEIDGVVYAARIPDGPILVLADSAALVWTGLVATESVGLPEYLVAHAGAPFEAIAADVRRLLDEFEQHGLVTNL